MYDKVFFRDCAKDLCSRLLGSYDGLVMESLFPWAARVASAPLGATVGIFAAAHHVMENNTGLIPIANEIASSATISAAGTFAATWALTSAYIFVRYDLPDRKWEFECRQEKTGINP